MRIRYKPHIYNMGCCLYPEIIIPLNDAAQIEPGKYKAIIRIDEEDKNELVKRIIEILQPQQVTPPHFHSLPFQDKTTPPNCHSSSFPCKEVEHEN